MKFLLTIFMIFLIGCGGNPNDNNITIPIDQGVQNRVYGESLDINIEIKSFKNTTLYKPKVIALNDKLPIVLFVPGWSSQNHLDYNTLLTFIASQGYIALYCESPMEYNAQELIRRYGLVLEDATVSKYIDQNNIGVIGHSSGGGLAFKVMDYFSKNGYGEKGRFIFSMDPWFAFEMREDDFNNFPKNTKVVIQEYMKNTTQDPRIALTIFDKLSILGDKNRDYQVYKDLTHGYPVGNKADNQMQIILKPLDALMDYVFYNNQDAYEISMELGRDNPSQNPVQDILSIYDYDYKCYGELESLQLVLETYKLNYCSILP